MKSTTTAAASGAPLFCAVIEAPFGALGIRTVGDRLHELVYLPPSFALVRANNVLSRRIAVQVERYFADPDFRFDVALEPVGTAFQKQVWQVIAAIPRGQVRTYGDVARRIGSAPRAVGQACGANWYPLVIPCHRVTASGGLGGFSHHDDAGGFHLGVKRWLLAHEGVKGYT